MLHISIDMPVVQVAGGKNESVLQPTWTMTNELLFVSDRSGWWNLYIEATTGSVKELLPMEAEFAGPAWMFGMRNYCVLSSNR